MLELIYSIIPLAIAYTIPLAVIALGGLFSERSGVVNIGLEGLMGIGAFASAITISSLFGSMGNAAVWIGLAAAILCGMVFSLLHAFASINMKANQVISGTAINLLSSAVTIYLARAITGSGNIQILKGFYKENIPLLSNIPIIGPLFFKGTYITTALVLVIFIVSWFVLYKLPFGLRLRACGENPQAADSMGINVAKMRYFGVVISGGLAGLGGAIIITTVSNEFSALIYNGLGFLALAALIFGKWRVWSVLGAAAFFGLAKTVADMSKLFPYLQDKPNIIFNTFPFVITLVALIVFSKNSVGPRAAGEPYDAGKR